ncbi:MAG: UDP-N-acetylmuramoyl-L-alanine--D-glutamate ligase [Psychromonas sp.]
MTDLNVAVLGLGITGLATVNYLQQSGYQVCVFDTRDTPPGEDKLASGIDLIKGAFCAEQLAKFPLIVASPGIALATPALQFAIAAGCQVIGDIELFAKKLKTPAYQHAKCVTITGSNGKSTVTSLLGEMAKQAGIKVAVGGNIGIPALDLLSPDIDLYILELSSFQLETTLSLDADIATILNISEDHLDRYNSYQHYIDSKQRIYAQSKVALFNSEDKRTFPENKKQLKKSFGFTNAHYHIVSDSNNERYLAKGEERLFAVKALKLSGRHNWLNALAAIALGEAVALAMPAMLMTLSYYSGLEHRCEFVAQANGVRWINDSKATNIGATQAALQGLSESISGDVHLILGGEGKGADFNELVPFLNAVNGQICIFGADAQKIYAATVKSTEKSKIVADLPAAIAHLLQHIGNGDLVILSPACASLDMYPNFMARGDHFKSLVNALIVSTL